jgi:multidrug efflux pump subunit AcrB
MNRSFNISEWALAHRSFVWFLVIIIVAAGGLSYLRLGRNEDPNFTIKTVVVQVMWPGANVTDTLQQITDRVEKKLQETPGLDYIRSYTLAGTSTVFVTLKGSVLSRDVPEVWYQVRKKIGDIRQNLPQGIVGPYFNDEFGDTYGIIYAFTADGFTQRELRIMWRVRAPGSLRSMTFRKSIFLERRMKRSTLSSLHTSWPAFTSIAKH